MMKSSRLTLLVRAELSHALRARWFLAYALLFLAAGAVLAALGGGTVIQGYRSSLRALAALLHLVILFVPVMALIPAIGALADDRESGMLEFLLAQPVSRGQVFVGKWAGTSAAMTLAVFAGLAPGLAGAILRGVEPRLTLLLLVLTVLLALGFVALGLLLAALTPARGRAMAGGVAVWLGLVVLGTLGIMAAFVRWGFPPELLSAWSLANPVEAFRLAILSVLDPELDLLGPVGASLSDRLGSVGLVGAAVASLALWAMVPGLVGLRVFRREGR